MSARLRSAGFSMVELMVGLVAGMVVNQIEVDPETEKWAKVALQRMLDLPARTAAKD